MNIGQCNTVLNTIAIITIDDGEKSNNFKRLKVLFTKLKVRCIQLIVQRSECHNMMSYDYIQINTTAPTRALANEIARLVIARGVAACAQVSGPILSVYSWKGKPEESEEWKVEIKTISSRYNEVREAIMLIHSYEVPEIIALPIVDITADYALWIDASVKKSH